MVKTVAEKAAELKTKLAATKKFWADNAAIELKDWTDAQKQEIDTLNKECEALNAEILTAKGYEGAKAQQDVMAAMLGKPVDRPDFTNTEPGASKSVKSIGEQFVESQEFKAFMKDLGVESPGQIPAEGTKIHMARGVEAKGLVITGTSPFLSGGAFVRRDYAPNVELPLRPLTIRSLISTGRTSSNLIEYVRTTAKTRAAAIVPEATNTAGGGYTAAAKPEASMAFEIVQEAVKTLAVWMPITRQILSDVPMLETMINNFLFEDLDLILEEEMITGAGGTSHFRGLENTPGITPHARVAADADLLDTARKALTTAMVVARARSTGFLLNPYDWQTISLIRNATAGTFYFGGPTVMGVEQLWGLPVATSEVIPQGTAYTGDLRQMMLWDRERPVLRVTDSHSDFFTHNIIAILAELRAAFGVLRPAAIVKIDLVIGANS